MIKFIDKLNQILATHVSLIVFSGIIIGLTTDIFGFISKEVLAYILFIELFIACFKIKKEDVFQIHLKSVATLIIFRYLLLPILAYFFGLMISPEVAVALLLLSLLPAGVTSPGFAGIFNANVTLVLSVVLITGILSPFYIPFMIKYIAGSNIEMSSIEMLKTILYIIVCPMFLHIPFRRVKSFNAFMINYNPLFIIPMVWITTVVPISKYRSFILENYLQSILVILGFLALYFIFCYTGIFFARNQEGASKKSYIISSSIHNITLGVILSLIYFSDKVSSLIILANVSAIVMVSLLKRILNKDKG